MYSLEGVTVTTSAVVGSVFDGLVATELSVELSVILGVSGEGLAETASLLPGMYSLEGVTVTTSAVVGSVFDGLVATELSVELSVIFGVSGEGLAETALVVFRLLYRALQKQSSGKKVITGKPIRLQAVSLQI